MIVIVVSIIYYASENPDATKVLDPLVDFVGDLIDSSGI